MNFFFLMETAFWMYFVVQIEFVSGGKLRFKYTGVKDNK